MSTKVIKSDVFSFLDDLCKKRIIFMDGAMGTMIQKYRFEENDYRGNKFKNHSIDLIYRNHLLLLE